MKRKRSYAAVDVEQLDVEALLPLLTVGSIVAIDVAKTKFVAAIATVGGEVLKLVKFEHPRQTVAFLGLLRALQQAERKPVVVMEPTGTYGDALRYQCHALGLRVHMMPPKHSHDFAEVLDGVPSMHDPKAATVLAKLQAIKPARAWQPESDTRRDLRAWVDQRHPIARTLAIYHGHLEAMLARHWPELEAHVDVYRQRSWFALLTKYPGPQAPKTPSHQMVTVRLSGLALATSSMAVLSAFATVRLSREDPRKTRGVSLGTRWNFFRASSLRQSSRAVVRQISGCSFAKARYAAPLILATTLGADAATVAVRREEGSTMAISPRC
jgi:hypothetical protein